MEKILISSLCCGMGLMDLGFTLKNKFKIVYAADMDEASVKVYKKNVSENVVKANIVDIKTDDIPKCHLIIGELPAIMSSNKDAQNLLIDNFIRIVKEANVNGFVIITRLFNKGTKLKNDIEKETDYKVSIKKVNFADFGSGVKMQKHIVIGMKERELNINDYRNFINSIPNKTIKHSLMDIDNYSSDIGNIISDEGLKRDEGLVLRLSEDECFSSISDSTLILGRIFNRDSTSLKNSNYRCRGRKYILIHPKLNRSFTREEFLSGLGVSKNNLGFKFDLLDNEIGITEQERIIANACSYDFSNNLAKIIEDFYMKNFI